MHSKKDCEETKGSSPDLMPSIMGAFDAYLHQKELNPEKTSTPKRSHQLSNFANLSPGVQKILSHVPEQEISKKFNSEETLGSRRNKVAFSSLRPRERGLNKSNESLDVSPVVHKMISNLQDSELVIYANRTVTKNNSYLYSRQCKNDSDLNVTFSEMEVKDESEQCQDFGKPLGSYLHSDKGIASRTPVGRKNMGKFVQVPSEASTGLTNSTVSSSEVSRPVSLTSLGSCSSSESSNGQLNQSNSTFLASAESLDSDPEPTLNQGSADSGIAEQEHSSIDAEQRVLQEVLDTEAVYVSDLQEVIQGYLDPWRNDPDCPLANYLLDIFTNLEEIHEFNRNILEDLRKANLDPTKTANVFLQYDSGFKVYNTYCAKYPRTMEVITALQKDDEMSKLIREKQILLNHALPLGSYLLKPVQRILKYHLLLQRLSKQCKPQHKPAVDLALATMTSVATDINNMKRKNEHAVRVQEIQSQLYGWTGADLTTLGELIVEGTFRVQGAKGRRHVFLFEQALLIAKSKSEGALAYKLHIECSNLMLVEQVRGDPFSFQVIHFDNPRLQCTLRAKSHHTKRDWTMQIKRAILENYRTVIPNHACQLIMQLGQDPTEDVTEKWSSPLKHSMTTPQYLEKRTRVKKSREGLKERSTSQDRGFTSFGSWRRKSEPMIPQEYDSKVIPKKITLLKKPKENGSTFYTDLSDSEPCNIVESTESLATRGEEVENHVGEIKKTTIETNLEKIVSELLMQNQDFHKVFNRTTSQNQRHPRRNVTSEPTIWYDERPILPSKADSLPRSFQLNQDGNRKEEEEGARENDLSSRLDDTDHPEYKIYRKTPIRLSMLQRIRMILSEEQRRNYNKNFPKNLNKTTGEKLAHPDYVDPQALFANSRNNSQANLSLDSGVASGTFDDLMGEPVRLDMTLNGKEVLKEVEKRLKDDYYESILDKSLTDEYVTDSTGKLVAKNDSFTNNDSHLKPIVLKRPNKAPPPIPAKPLRLIKTQTMKSNGQSWVKAMVGRFE